MLLPAGLAFLMFVVGSGLSAGALAAAFRAPRALMVGLTVQMAGLPLLAWGLTWLIALPPESAAGLMITALAPGGITSNYAALLARGDVALSTAMTLVTNLVAPLTIPVILSLSGLTVHGGPGGSLIALSLVMTGVTAVPLVIGMMMRRYASGVMKRVSPALSSLSKLVFTAIVLATFYQNRFAMLDVAAQTGIAVVLLNLGGIAAAFAAARLSRLGPQQAMGIAVETGLQNIALVIVVATTLLGEAGLASVGLLYAVAMNVSALGLIAYGRRNPAALSSS